MALRIITQMIKKMKSIDLLSLLILHFIYVLGLAFQKNLIEEEEIMWKIDTNVSKLIKLIITLNLIPLVEIAWDTG